MKSTIASGKGIPFFCTLICLLSFNFSVFSQNGEIEQLRKQREEKQERLELLQQWMQDIQQTKSASREQLSILNEQIELIEGQLKGLRREVVLFEAEITQNLEQIDLLEAKIAKGREDYGKLAFVTYKSLIKRPQSFYFLSSSSFVEGRNRMRYIQEFQKDRVRLFERIQDEQDSLRKVKIKLEKDKREKEVALFAQEAKNKDLQKKKDAAKQMYADLKIKENEYSEDIKQLEKDIREIDRKIDQLMKEIAKNKAKPSEIYDIIPDLKGKFAQSKGKIPWPVPTSTGDIYQEFGEITLPNGIRYDNKGVDFRVKENQSVRAVFAGVVEKVTEMAIVGKVVVINHGDYLTMYTRLSEANVKVGDKVEKLQTIGKAKMDKRLGISMVHLRVYKGETPLNPQSWLVKKK